MSNTTEPLPIGGILKLVNDSNKQQKTILCQRRHSRLSKKLFEKNINKLIELGYEKEQCKLALKAAFGNVDRAVDYLISGNIPSSNFSTVQEIRERQNDIVKSAQHKVAQDKIRNIAIPIFNVQAVSQLCM